MKEIALKVGARIRYFRTLKELSQEKLALEAGINPAFLGHLERGLKSPTVDTLAKISEALNITLSKLLDFEEEKGVKTSEIVDKLAVIIENLPNEDSERIVHIILEISKIYDKYGIRK